MILIIGACSTTKDLPKNDLFNTIWELEFLSGPRIAFSGLFPNKKPVITFNESTKLVEGSDGCNGYSSGYTLNGSQLSFGEPGPSTMMYCGEGEQFFRKIIAKIDSYKIDENGKLNLLMDEVPMMRFKKIVSEN